MKIKYIQHEVMNDAPFIGALVVANDCTRGCKGCFNQELKKLKSCDKERADVIKEVQTNPMNEGIILGGLEWSEQPKDMMLLSYLALAQGYHVMIYTHLVEEDFFKLVWADELMCRVKSCIPKVFKEVGQQRPFLFIKFGHYDESLKCDNNTQYGVKLATSNQYIRKY